MNRILSRGINNALEQAQVNRVKRINLFYVIMVSLLTISAIFALFTGKPMLAIRDCGVLAGTLLIYFFVPASKKPELSSMLVLSICALQFLSAQIFDFGADASLILAFYLLFPFAAVSINAKNGINVSIGLGISILTLNSIPGIETYIHLELSDAMVFSVAYIILILLAHYSVQANRRLMTTLKEARSQSEDKMTEKDEFISKLSHKLRTSLGNITLINNLVNDSRLTSQQKELMETLKASTNNLIDDVNNIVEITSPGIINYTKSIISFYLSRVLDEAVQIYDSGSSSYGEVNVDSGQINQFLIGDPNLVRSLVINIIKGLSLYKQTNNPVTINVEMLQETPSQIRLKFSFTILTDLGKDLISYLDDLKRGKSVQGSSLSTAHSLLLESESQLIASPVRKGVTVSFFQDFAKDAYRSVPEYKKVREKGKEARKPVDLKESRVLLVEDNEINQKIVLLSLNKKVKKIDVACNGKEAVEMFVLKQYDIILMDIMMPIMDGLTATTKIREIESTNNSHIPIIAITANALQGDKDNCLAAGADEYIAKPFHAEVLVMKMKKLLA
ncbi:MAG: response regulator [Bacteroidetes bacterium]|nr:response regulator [Bacteroidota bacterium]